MKEIINPHPTPKEIIEKSESVTRPPAIGNFSEVINADCVRKGKGEIQ